MPRDDEYLREAVDRAREEYHEVLQRFDPMDRRSRDTAWATVRDAMKRYQTAMDDRITYLSQR